MPIETADGKGLARLALMVRGIKYYDLSQQHHNVRMRTLGCVRRVATLELRRPSGRSLDLALARWLNWSPERPRKASQPTIDKVQHCALAGGPSHLRPAPAGKPGSVHWSGRSVPACLQRGQAWHIGGTGGIAATAGPPLTGSPPHSPLSGTGSI